MIFAYFSSKRLSMVKPSFFLVKVKTSSEKRNLDKEE
jgi:hypothetical protein